MKIKLVLSDENHDIVADFLTKHGIEIDDSSEFVLIEQNRYPQHLTVKDGRGERALISVYDIVLIETFGHTVSVVTADGEYTSQLRLYQLELTLDPARFLRISNSVIIQRNKIKRILPSLSMRFVLEMCNSRRVDVTRSYYLKFKEYFKI